MDMIIIRRVPANHVKQQWPRVERWVKDACAYTDGHEVADELKRLCISDPSHRLCLLEHERKVVGVLVIDADQTSVHLTTVAGNLPKDWKPTVLDYLKNMASGLRASKVTCKGRRGWERALKPLGFIPAPDGYLEVLL